jgi:hypothetical protein
MLAFVKGQLDEVTPAFRREFLKCYTERKQGGPTDTDRANDLLVHLAGACTARPVGRLVLPHGTQTCRDVKSQRVEFVAARAVR